jgi:AcrR family transcriptional regulator
MAASERSAPQRGRPAAASREDVLTAAMYRFLRGRRIDIRAIATELGLARPTIYRWLGSREDLIGEVLILAADPLLDEARASARGRGGRVLLDTFDRFNRSLADAPALRQFVEQEHDAALRIICSGAGRVQPHLVARIAGLIEAEAFLFNDAVAGMRGDVDRLREIEAALLGVSAR